MRVRRGVGRAQCGDRRGAAGNGAGYRPAGGRTNITIERVAINVDDARIPDNQGQQPVDEPIVAGGPAAYFSTLPIKAMVSSMREAGIPAAVSQTAGTYVCNHVMYGLLHRLSGQHEVKGGFIHIPYLPEQAAAHPGAPSMAASTVLFALSWPFPSLCRWSTI